MERERFNKLMWRWECQTCGNRCLNPSSEERPTECHSKCPKPDWKLLKYQQTYKVNGENWTHPDGEI